MRRRQLITATLLTLGLAAAGCGSSDGGAAPDGGGDGGAAETGSFVDRLALLPGAVAQGDGGILVTMADIEAAARAAGVSPPSGPEDQAAVSAYVNALTSTGTPGGPTPAVAALLPQGVGRGALARAGEFQAELGWSVLDLRWFVEYPTAPRPLTVAGGTFTTERLSAAMGEADGGRWRVGDGEDLSIDPGARTVARPLGQPLTLALDSGRLYVSPVSGHVQAAVGSTGDTLADLPELRALAGAMDTQGAYATMLSARDNYRGGGDNPLRPFTGVATGLAHDGGPVLLLAYAHADAGNAEANATALRTLLTEGSSARTRQPWSELLSVTDITVDGSTVVARLTLGQSHPQLAWQLLTSRDSLVQHGG
ncbi:MULTISPECIES: hypothetical protein [Micromonospora]|uniref:Lipoprotein n=1 Tax=Micromonospora yangpuensis TaxID=683228 RepID=A0A1C6UYS4_9ACTN|nr:hypothetical protein [Micromonospora yangpuensis]SCL59162.1 hypothetical protein GA0070617_4020 [Micromonospora yangpuensis]